MIRSLVGRTLAPCLLALGALSAQAAAEADGSYGASWGPAVGEPAPAIDAPDQDGTTRDLASLGRENGLLLLFSRSVDW